MGKYGPKKGKCLFQSRESWCELITGIKKVNAIMKYRSKCVLRRGRNTIRLFEHIFTDIPYINKVELYSCHLVACQMLVNVGLQIVWVFMRVCKYCKINKKHVVPC